MEETLLTIRTTGYSKDGEMYTSGEVLEEGKVTLWWTARNGKGDSVLAKYTALYNALATLETTTNLTRSTIILIDSQAVIRQLSGMWKVHREDVKCLLNLIAIICMKASEKGTSIYLRWASRKTFKEMYEGLRRYADSRQRCNETDPNISARENFSNRYGDEGAGSLSA